MVDAYWIHANVDGQARWHLVLDKGGEVDFAEIDFAEIDFQEKMSLEEYREEFPGNRVIGPILRPGSCTCDAIGDSPCPEHWRENELQNRAINAEEELKSAEKIIVDMARHIAAATPNEEDLMTEIAKKFIAAIG